MRGLWQHQRELFRDNNTKLIRDVEDSAENRAFFVSMKERLKKRFQQIEIYITSHQIDVI